MGWSDQDIDEYNRVKQLGEIYQACSNELQVFLLPTATLPKGWVDIPLLLAGVHLLADMHKFLVYYG